MPGELRELVYAVMGKVPDPPRSAAQAKRRLAEALKAAKSVMRSQGYYAAEISANVDQITEDAESDESAKTVAVLTIKPGPQFKYGTIDVTFGDSPPDTAEQTQEKIELTTGEPAIAARVVAAELRMINFLNTQGYPDAAAMPREAVVDYDTQTMTLNFNIEPGSKTRFGEIIQTGTAYLHPSWPKLISEFEPGDVFDVRKLNAMNSRVIGTGVFESANTSLAKDNTPNADGTITRNVQLNVDQGAINTVSGEVGYSTTDGSGVSLTYERRNFIGYAQTLTINTVLKTNQIGIGADYNIPFAWRLDRELDFSGEITREDTEAFTGERVEANAFLTQKVSSRFKLGLGFGLEASRFEEDGIDQEAYLIDILGRAIYDNRNSIFDPETGFLVEANLVPSYNFGENKGYFGTAVLSGATYKRISDTLVLAGRAKVGSILASDIQTIPLNRRFYAGGGGSVRGFGYQTVSPTSAAGQLIGGRAVAELSGEVRYRGESPFGFAAFVDAGSVTQEQYPSLDDVRVGAGVGVRYYTSFAPLRADIAIPLNKREGDEAFQVYISIGQSF